MSQPVTRVPCHGCQSPLRRSAGLPLCRSCMALGERLFRAEHSPLDADWIAARNTWFGGRQAPVLAAVRAERRTAGRVACWLSRSHRGTS